MVSRRTTLKGIAAGVGAGMLSTRAFSQNDGAIKIGVLTALTGPQAPFTGPGTVMATRLAAEHFQRRHPGIKVEVSGYDIQYNANIVVSLTRKLLDSEGFDAIVDVPMSAGAISVAPMVAERNKVALFNSVGTTLLTGANCNTNHVHWTHDSYALSSSVVISYLKEGGKKWFFITADNAFGQDLENTAAKLVKAGGGTVLGSVKHPYPGNTEFSTYLLHAQASGADVIALATTGSDAVNCIKQAAEFGVGRGKQKLAGLWLDLYAIQSLGLAPAQGLVFTEAFYWDQSDRTRAFAREFKSRHGAVPYSTQAGAYSAVTQYLNKVAQIGVANAKKSGKAVVDALKSGGEMDDPVFGKVSVRQDGRTINPMTIVQVKKPSESKSPEDAYHVKGFIPGKEAFRPMAEGGCPLVKA